MTAGLLTNKKYDLKVSEDIEEAHYRPICIPHRDFYESAYNNHTDSMDIMYVHHGKSPNNPDPISVYHHVSGATITVGVEDVEILGTKKAINDAQSSLELLTERRLIEVRRELLIEA
jgi:hypothetical protein